MRIVWCIQHKPENFCKTALLDSEFRPLNLVFLLWIRKFTKNGSIYEKQQPQKTLKSNIIRIENL